MDLSKWKYFVLFYEDNDQGMMVYHLVGYEKIPSTENINYNIEELVYDEDFGIGEKARSLQVTVIDQETAMEIMEQE